VDVTENILIRILWLHARVAMAEKDTTKHAISIKPVSFLVTIFIPCWVSPVPNVLAAEEFFGDSAVVLAGKLRHSLIDWCKVPV
jgi:hypothetical protein